MQDSEMHSILARFREVDGAGNERLKEIRVGSQEAMRFIQSLLHAPHIACQHALPDPRNQFNQDPL